MTEQTYLCDTCSHDADCEIEEQRTAEEGCNMYVPEGWAEAPAGERLCDSCGKVDTCAHVTLHGPLDQGASCGSGYEPVMIVDPDEEEPTYTVAEILNGFEDMFRRGLDDLAAELKKHDMNVKQVGVGVETTHEFVVGKAFPQVSGQVFSVDITVGSIRKA